jgi:hypothetical protein
MPTDEPYLDCIGPKVDSTPSPMVDHPPGFRARAASS